MTFSNFASHLGKIEATAKRNEMTTLLVELLKEAPPSEIDKVVYLSLGQLAPLYLHKEFGMAEKLIVRAIAIAYQTTDDAVRKLFKQTGDFGEAALSLRGVRDVAISSKTDSHGTYRSGTSLGMTVTDVFSALTAIADASGTGSQEQKLELTAKLLNSLDPLGAKYVVRIILDKLRLGFSDKTVLDALSVMTSGDKSDREKLESIYNVRPDVGWLAKQIKLTKSPQFPKSPKLGVPVLPALCQRLPTTEEIVKKMCRPPTQSRGRALSIEESEGNVAVEPKWDGQRIQAHVGLNANSELAEVHLFTRSLEDVTDMFPDLVKSLSVIPAKARFDSARRAGIYTDNLDRSRVAARDDKKITSLILDGEIIGVDPKSGNVLPFQTMITRKRKYGIAKQLLSVPIRYMVFDILSLNNKSLMDKPFSKRRQALEQIFNHLNHLSPSLSLAPQLVTNDPVKIRDFLKEQIDRGLEGIVAKQIDAPYSPGRTGFTWVKMKWEGDAKSGGLLDTIDCVVMGIYAGRGKRSSFGVGAFLVGILNTEYRIPNKKSKPLVDGHSEFSIQNSVFLTISKIGTGLSDEQWRKLKVESGKLKVESCPKEYDVPKELTPDAWLEPKIVVEIQADNITKSPLHTAGFALRFPRLVRYRTDKRPEQITTLKEVKKLYQLQK